MPEASAPHVMCDAQNLLLNTSLWKKARCPKHRPGYLCRSSTYHRYEKGAFALACEIPRVDLSSFPRDHLRDIVESISSYSLLHVPSEWAVEERPALLVTREISEHGNVFHTLTDLLNVYITLRMLRWEGEPHHLMLLLDDHPDSPLDPLWAAVANPIQPGPHGGLGEVWRAADLGPGKVFRQAAFVPPGYSSLLFAHLYEDNSCPNPTSLFIGFRRWLLQRLGLLKAPQTDRALPLKVLLVSRRAQAASLGRRASKKLARTVSNEAQLLESIQALDPAARVTLVDLALLPLHDQLKLVTEADVLIGMHGAALAWSLLMQPGAGLLELWPQLDGIWKCYQHTAEWAGLYYRRWRAPETGIVPATKATEVNTEEVRTLYLELITAVRAKRDASSQQHVAK